EPASLHSRPTPLRRTLPKIGHISGEHVNRFEQLSEETISFVEEIERISGRPVSLLSTDFNWRNVIDRRAW
ncbi:hypothetical protein, partial [Qipengyuania citrea]|uniref:hypothetical protein n=1 Tax=Qipengyuania citrea TaxID=225971 RepID=UPI001D17760D